MKNNNGIERYSETTPVRALPSGIAQNASIIERELTLPSKSAGVFSSIYALKGDWAIVREIPITKQIKELSITGGAKVMLKKPGTLRSA